jgi:hypothetical protein
MSTQEASNQCVSELENGDITPSPFLKGIIAVDLDDVLSNTNEYIAACSFTRSKSHHSFSQGLV